MSEQKGGADYGAWMMLFIAIIVIGICWLIWFLFKYQLIQMVLWVRYAELSAIGAVFGSDHAIPVSGYDEPMRVSEWKEFALSANPKEIAYEHIRVTTVMTMTYFKYVFAFLMGILCIWVVFKGPTSLYRRKLDLEGLIHEQAKNFRTIAPFIKFNPQKMPFRARGMPVPAELPMFSEALDAEEWIAYNRIPAADGQLDEDAIEKSFARQLGKPWKGALKQKDYVQVLLASFCLKMCRKRDESDQMLGELAHCWDSDKGLKISGALKSQARKVLRDKKMAEKFHKIVNKHAFVTSALLAGLEAARNEGGVLAPAQFVWLRGHDRNLWYALNNLGRKAFHMEAMGAMAHFHAEKQVGRPIPKAKVMNAVRSLIAYREESSDTSAIPELDYSMVKDKKKNKGVLKPV